MKFKESEHMLFELEAITITNDYNTTLYGLRYNLSGC